MPTTVDTISRIREVDFLTHRCQIICGVDEAGRGPLAGPVVAAAVISSSAPIFEMARDSKTLTAEHRERLFEEIVGCCEVGLGTCSPDEIDELNILQASLLAMTRAVSALAPLPDLVLVDGNRTPSLSMPSKAIVRGDVRVASISAASIVAKVSRDRLMARYAIEYPEYGFGKHFGYPTLSHRMALREFGPCPIHRKTFRGVRELVNSSLHSK